MVRRFGRYSAVAALLVLLAAGQANAGSQPLKVGTEVFAVDPGRVIEVTFRSTGTLLLAHRWEPGEQFTLIFLEQSQGPPATCRGGQGFAVVLNHLTSLKVRRTLTAGEAQELLGKKPVSAWAEVVIRDQTALAPFRARLMPVPGRLDETFVHFDGATYVVGLPHQVFHLISGGCKALAGAAPLPE
jgi:hypothetical protein